MPVTPRLLKRHPARNAIAVSVIALFGLGAYAGQAATQDQASFVDVRATMTGPVNSATMEIWDVGNNAMSDTGGIDPALMNESTWLRLATAGDRLAAAMHSMASADVIVSAAITDGEEPPAEPGTVSMADVQRYIDADPVAFKALAEGMAKHAEELAMAARFQDAEAAGELVAELDLVCETCHSQFWYPEQ